MGSCFMEQSCADFAAQVAAKTSIPCGGSAVAYVGALAAALASVVSNFTIGKKKYAQYEEDVLRLLDESEAVRERLVQLVDEDAQAFCPLSQAYGIPKEDPGRQDALECATKGAIVAPLEMMRQIARSIEVLEELLVKGSRLFISDVGCGTLLAAAALRAAAMNVFINTKSLVDREYAAAIDAECDELLSYVERAEAVSQEVMAQLRA